MKYISLSLDVEGLENNKLYVYARAKDKLKRVNICGADFVITDKELKDTEPLDAVTRNAKNKNATPPQLHNILFFETLKAFRR